MTARPAALLVATALIVLACSTQPSATQTATGPVVTPRATTIALVLDEMTIAPAVIDVPRGADITFVVTNEGLVEHEVYFGNSAAQDAHEEEMAEMGAMPHEHSNSVIVPAGQTGELKFTFRTAGEWLAGCHLPGHYSAGMVAAVNVVE